MDTNGNEEFVSNLNYNLNTKVSQCCDKYFRKSRTLEKALEKEKKKRRKVENAFKQLLLAYNSIVDAKKFDLFFLIKCFTYYFYNNFF